MLNEFVLNMFVESINIQTDLRRPRLISKDVMGPRIMTLGQGLSPEVTYQSFFLFSFCYQGVLKQVPLLTYLAMVSHKNARFLLRLGF